MKLKKAPVVVTVVSNGVALRLAALYDVLIVIDRSVKAKSKKKKPKESNSLDHLFTGSHHSGPCFYLRGSLSLSDKFYHQTTPIYTRAAYDRHHCNYPQSVQLQNH